MTERARTKNYTQSWLLLAFAVAMGLPALALSGMIRLTGSPDLYPWAGSLVFGVGIMGAAFLLAWGSEVAQLDISQALALALVALVAVLPEYAVDLYLAWSAGGQYAAWQAGSEPACNYCSLAAANMTGANRLIVGLGWPTVVLLYWLKTRKDVPLGKGVSLELVMLLAGSVYSLSLFFKGSIALWDTAVLFPMFALYLWLSSRTERHEPDLVGPPAAVATLSVGRRRTLVALMFLFAAGVILFSAELFAEGLRQTGQQFGIDEYHLIQWLAPLASEAPEMVVATYFALRGQPGAALAMLVSATVNQWTLLVGSLPVVFSLALGEAHSLPLTLDANPATVLNAVVHQQQAEFLLTMAETLFAVVLVLRLTMSWRGALVLLGLFVAQLVLSATEARFYFGLLFLALAALLLVGDHQRVRGVLTIAGYMRESAGKLATRR